MVDAKQVRDLLTNLSEDRVPTPTIEENIKLAETTINNEKASNIDDKTIEAATLTHAVWLTISAYAAKLERSTGRVPPPNVASQLEFWSTINANYMRYIKRSTFTSEALVVQPETLYELAKDGEFNGEPY